MLALMNDDANTKNGDVPSICRGRIYFFLASLLSI